MLDELADCFDFAYLRGCLPPSVLQSSRGILSKKDTSCRGPVQTSLTERRGLPLHRWLAASRQKQACASGMHGLQRRAQQNARSCQLGHGAVAIRLPALLARKARNRLAHASNGNSAMLFGNEVPKYICIFIYVYTYLTGLLSTIGNMLLFCSFSRLASVCLVAYTQDELRGLLPEFFDALQQRRLAQRDGTDRDQQWVRLLRKLWSPTLTKLPKQELDMNDCGT